MNNEKKQQIIELLKDKEVADSIGVISEGLVKLFESIPADKPEGTKPYDPGFWVPKSGDRFYKAGFDDDGAYARSDVCSDPEHINRENCWKTSKRAINVGKKMKFLMLVERIRDKIQYEGATTNGLWVIVFNEGDFNYAEIEAYSGEPYTSSLFLRSDIANKACDILNKMKADGQLDWLFDE